MNSHKSGTITWIAITVMVAALIACSGCGSSSPYGAAADTERSVCASVGQQATTSLSHGGYVTRCGLPE
jgi:hypothetical protein